MKDNADELDGENVLPDFKFTCQKAIYAHSRFAVILRATKYFARSIYPQMFFISPFLEKTKYLDKIAENMQK